jgi:hypothetical protein
MAQNDVSHEAFLAVNNITPRSLEREKERERERERVSMCIGLYSASVFYCHLNGV